MIGALHFGRGLAPSNMLVEQIGLDSSEDPVLSIEAEGVTWFLSVLCGRSLRRKGDLTL
jgi:hypothetical protein